MYYIIPSYSNNSLLGVGDVMHQLLFDHSPPLRGSLVTDGLKE